MSLILFGHPIYEEKKLFAILKIFINFFKLKQLKCIDQYSLAAVDHLIWFNKCFSLNISLLKLFFIPKFILLATSD